MLSLFTIAFPSQNQLKYKAVCSLVNSFHLSSIFTLPWSLPRIDGLTSYLPFLPSPTHQRLSASPKTTQILITTKRHAITSLSHSPHMLTDDKVRTSLNLHVPFSFISYPYQKQHSPEVTYSLVNNYSFWLWTSREPPAGSVYGFPVLV